MIMNNAMQTAAAVTAPTFAEEIFLAMIANTEAKLAYKIRTSCQIVTSIRHIKTPMAMRICGKQLRSHSRAMATAAKLAQMVDAVFPGGGTQINKFGDPVNDVSHAA